MEFTEADALFRRAYELRLRQEKGSTLVNLDVHLRMQSDGGLVGYWQIACVFPVHYHEPEKPKGGFFGGTQWNFGFGPGGSCL